MTRSAPLDALIDEKHHMVRSFWTLEEPDMQDILKFNQVYIELGIFSLPIPPVSIICWPDGTKGMR